MPANLLVPTHRLIQIAKVSSSSNPALRERDILYVVVPETACTI